MRRAGAIWARSRLSRSSVSKQKRSSLWITSLSAVSVSSSKSKKDRKNTQSARLGGKWAKSIEEHKDRRLILINTVWAKPIAEPNRRFLRIPRRKPQHTGWARPRYLGGFSVVPLSEHSIRIPFQRVVLALVLSGLSVECFPCVSSSFSSRELR